MSTRTSPGRRSDWKSARDGVDLAAVATGLLGPAPGRVGERGRRLWWPCPFHEDRNPSFCVDPGRVFWRCFGCGEHGDAASLVMRLEGLTFPEAVARLTGGGPAPSRSARPHPMRPARTEPEAPNGMPHAEALALIAESSARLWSPEGAGALAYLTGPRGLSTDTIRAARLGWTPGVRLVSRDGRPYTARGVVIPWLDGDRLALLKIRQPEGVRPKYAEAFRDRPASYPGPGAIRPGRPLVVPEGEFDALLLAQEFGELAAVVTLGSASARPAPGLVAPWLASPLWYIATDADDAGDKAAAGWPPRARRARPPTPFNDWTEARQAGLDLRRWWSERLAGIEAPPLFTWPELARLRWGPSEGDPETGIIVDQTDTARRMAALAALWTGRGDADESP